MNCARFAAVRKQSPPDEMIALSIQVRCRQWLAHTARQPLHEMRLLIGGNFHRMQPLADIDAMRRDGVVGNAHSLSLHLRAGRPPDSAPSSKDSADCKPRQCGGVSCGTNQRRTALSCNEIGNAQA